jgi:hypothetical protein
MRALHAPCSFRAIAADKRGTVTIFGAALIASLIGIVSLVAEYGLTLERQTEDQRIADMAAFAAATYYGAHSGDSNVLAMATSVAQNIGQMNGIPATGVSAAVVTSPQDSTKNALRVIVTTTPTLFLGKVLGAHTTLTTTGTSYAQFGGGVSACITALSASTGITLSGGTAISAPQCGISTNATLTVPCGTTITAKGVSYGGATPTQGCSGITASTLTHASVTDPLATNTGVVAAEAHVASIASQAGPSAPTVSSPTISFDLSWKGATSQTSGSCTASLNSSTWTIACPNGGTYNFASFADGSSKTALGGGMTVLFNTGGNGTSVYNFSTVVNDSGSSMTFGPGVYNFAAGFISGNGNTNTFAGGGTYNFGRSTTKCSNGAYYSICDTSTVTFSGASAFALSSGIYVGGGATLTMGSGTNNSFNIGAASDGNAFWLGGGAKITLADATGNSSLFQVTGNVNADAGGGSCMSLGAATNHDINGWFSTAGGTILGAGTYSINGYLAYGNNGGGSVTCNGSTVGLQGTGVTIIYSAATTPSSGTCAGKGLCFAAGFSNVSVSAPSSGTYAFLLFVGPQSGNSAGAYFSGGSGASMSGAFYLPVGAFTMSGGAYINTLTGGCLQIVALSVSMSGGTTAASTCITGSGGSGSSTPKFVM